MLIKGMSAIEFWRIRRYLGCTGKEMAFHLGLSSRTITRLENGARIQGPVREAMRAMEKLKQHNQPWKRGMI